MDGERYQIDYILIQERYRNGLKNARTVPEADIDSDHSLVLANMRIKLKNIKKVPPKKVLDVEKFKEETVKEKFASIVTSFLHERYSEDPPVQERWKNIKQ